MSVLRRPSDRPPLADRMYEVLLGQFMDGTRGAGGPLNIGALAREFDVSQTPLREALARLEHTGLVRREALKGYSVAPQFTPQELGNLMAARLVLEPVLAVEASKRTTEEFLSNLNATITDLERAGADADVDTEFFKLYWTSDHRFHSLIAQQSGNTFLEGAYRSLSGQVQRFRLFAKAGSTDAGAAATEHRAIYQALAAGDSSASERLMRGHIEAARDRALRGAKFAAGAASGSDEAEGDRAN